MNIRFDNVIPIPLKNQHLHNDSVWNTDCTFHSGEKILIKAPSGTGKTTFALSVYGLRTDFEGDIFFEKQNSKSFNQKQWAAMRQTSLSVVFQDLRLFPQLTARENLLLKQKLTGDDSVLLIEEMAFKLDVTHKLDQKVQYLSLGQQQRFAIIRALLQPFKWLLLDEPFSHLDNENVQRACGLISEVCAQNNAGLFVTSLEDNHSFHYTRTVFI